ncbi:MAG TPA: hypothetical protein VKZ53_27915 [Candidatus Angelobacter sp.]|nr:hypothetical protein [Candidatus Angelobacter sp.]
MAASGSFPESIENDQGNSEERSGIFGYITVACRNSSTSSDDATILYLTDDVEKNNLDFDFANRGIPIVVLLWTLEISISFPWAIDGAELGYPPSWSGSQSGSSVSFKRSNWNWLSDEKIIFTIKKLAVPPSTPSGMHFAAVSIIGLLGSSRQVVPLLVTTLGPGFVEMRTLHFDFRKYLGLEQNGIGVVVPRSQKDEVFVNKDPRFVFKHFLQFYVANRGGKIAKRGNSRLEVALTMGNGQSALAGLDSSGKLPSDVEITFVGSSAQTLWTVEKKTTTSGWPHWILTPTGQSFFEIGEVATFTLARVQPNDDLGTAAIYLAYCGLPEHQDGIVPLWIRKTFHDPEIVFAQCSSQGIVSQPRVRFSWVTLGARPQLNIHGFNGTTASIPDLNAVELGYELDLTQYPDARVVTISTDSTGSKERVICWVRYQP